MARVLVHFDIADDEFRATFRSMITASNFDPRFTPETESVYCAQLVTTPRNIDQLVRALKQASRDAPEGSRILMEHPAMDNNRPEIVQTAIV